MEFRKKLVNGIWILYGRWDTGAFVYDMPKIFGHATTARVDEMGNALATANGATYDPDNHDPF